MTKAPIADVSGAAWTTAQRDALDAAFTKLGEALDSVLLMRGERVLVEAEFEVGYVWRMPCAFKPKSVHVVGATKDGVTYINNAWSWEWAASPLVDGVITFTEISTFLGFGTYTFDVFMERDDG